MATYISILVLLESPSFHFKTSVFFYLGPVDSFLIFFFLLLHARKSVEFDPVTNCQWDGLNTLSQAVLLG